MKNYNILVLFLLFLGLSCNDSEEPTFNFEEMEAEYTILQEERLAIEALAIAEVCVDESSCDYVAFGSKPCGGPWTYLAYNSNIDVDAFLQRVEIYNNNEESFNLKWGIASDCSTPAPPNNVECIDGVCTAVYN